MIAWQEPPPYIEVMAEVEMLAATAGGCQEVGYAVSVPAGEAELRDLTRRSVIAGVNASWVGEAFQSAIQRQAADMDAMMPPLGADEDENRRAMSQTRELLNSRCADAAARYPAIVSPGPDVGRVFMGWMGPWLDYPLVGEASYYLGSRATCREYLVSADPEALVTHWSPAFADLPQATRSSLRTYLVDAHEPIPGPAMTADQCTRIMAGATTALTSAWSNHFGGNPPTQALP